MTIHHFAHFCRRHDGQSAVSLPNGWYKCSCHRPGRDRSMIRIGEMWPGSHRDSLSWAHYGMEGLSGRVLVPRLAAGRP